MSDKVKASAPTGGPGAAYEALIEVMQRLRAPDGCPWDQVQTFESIAPYTIEEAYEVADAIERGDMLDLKEELGDLLLQVVYHSRIAEERGVFDAADVAQAVTDKMIRRHPHVFGDAERADWETIKAAEKAEKRAARAAAGLAEPDQGGVLADVPAPLPALTRAEKLQQRAARVGFDWPNASHVLDKLVEEAAELREAAAEADADAMEDEFGDLLFVVVNLGRHMKIDPEKALRARQRQIHPPFSRRRNGSGGRRPQARGRHAGRDGGALGRRETARTRRGALIWRSPLWMSRRLDANAQDLVSGPDPARTPRERAGATLKRAMNDETIIQRCEELGLRMTGQRRVIARVLAGADDHPDAEELHRRALKIDSKISLATVYRTVKLFEDAGIVERHEFRDGRARYEDAERAHHDHLIDLDTGAVIEFVDAEIEELQRRVAERLGYEMVAHRLELYCVRRDRKKPEETEQDAPPPSREDE